MIPTIQQQCCCEPQAEACPGTCNGCQFTYNYQISPFGAQCASNQCGVSQNLTVSNYPNGCAWSIFRQSGTCSWSQGVITPPPGGCPATASTKRVRVSMFCGTSYFAGSNTTITVDEPSWMVVVLVEECCNSFNQFSQPLTAVYALPNTAGCAPVSQVYPLIAVVEPSICTPAIHCGAQFISVPTFTLLP